MAERPFANVLQQLRGAGLRPTRQRLALARLLSEGGNRHLTAEQLHDEAQQVGIKVSLATVYNTLHQFTHAGLLRQVVVDATRTYFDTNTTEHHHFFIEDSGELRDIPGDAIRVSDLPDSPAGTEISRIDVVIRVRPTSDASY